MEILVPDSFASEIEMFEAVAEIQDKIFLTTDDEIGISLSNPYLLQNQLGIFLLLCLNAFGAQKRKNIILRCSFPSCAWDDRDLASYFQLHTKADVISLVTKNISKKIPVQMTEKLSDILVSLIGEVYNNAVEHSGSDYIIGNCYNESGSEENDSKMYFFCYDAGKGIIESVRRYLHKDQDALFQEYGVSARLLDWALKKGNTTKQPPRGVGIDWLLGFAKSNSGYVRICNEHVLFEQNSDGAATYKRLEKKFYGLFFEMHIRETPEVIYRLKGE